MNSIRKAFGRVDDFVAAAEDVFLVAMHGSIAALVLLAVVMLLTWLALRMSNPLADNDK